MDNKGTHRIIKKVFRLRTLYDDNLPLGSSKRYDRKLFPKLFARLGFNKGAEIGVRKGEYSRRFCKENPDLKLY